MAEAVPHQRHGVLARRVRWLIGLGIVAAGSMVLGSEFMGSLS